MTDRRHRQDAAESEIRELASCYQRLIGGDHHKDRDCHWYVQKRWSYGDGPYYTAQHYGYCFTPWKDGEAPDRQTYREALNDLRDGLERAIREVESWKAA